MWCLNFEPMTAISKKSITAGITTTLAILLFGQILPNVKTLFQIFSFNTATFGEKFAVLGSFIFFTQKYTFAQGTLFILQALLAGILVTLLVLSYQKRGRLAAKTGVAGMISGVFGFGCAACGSLAISGVLSALGLGGLVLLLPLGGLEFSIGAVLLFLLAIVFLIREVRKPAVCLKM